MINGEVDPVEVDEEIACYRCGSILDIEDSHCNNCGTPLREDSILL